MADTVIKVENLSKRYRLGRLRSSVFGLFSPVFGPRSPVAPPLCSVRTLTEDLNRWWARVRHKPDRKLSQNLRPVYTRASLSLMG